MISFPGIVEENSLYECIVGTHGPQNDKTWRAWRYDTSVSGDYRELSSGTQDEKFSVRPGRGHWFVASDNRKLGLGTSLEALSTPTDVPFAIPLEPGWNMVGNPFYFPVSWSDCVVETETGMLTMAEAGSFVDTLWTYSPDDESYTPDVNVLQRMAAYWVYSDSTVILHVPAKKHVEGTSVAVDRAAQVRAESGWRLEIRADCSGAKDRHNYAGYHASAELGWDRHDWREPPMQPGDALAVYFPHNGWGRRSGRYAADIRGEYEQLSLEQYGLGARSGERWGHVWRFDVAKNFVSNSAGDEVRLSFVGLDDLPDEATAFLIGGKLERAIDLRQQDRYAFFQGEKDFVSTVDDARFSLVVGSDEFVERELDRLTDTPRSTALQQNYPNPFNPSTIVRYDLASPSNVDLRIYDVNGALVKTLERGVRPAGRYEVAWQGRNNSDNPVASGVYFCRLRAGAFTQVRKMLLLK